MHDSLARLALRVQAASSTRGMRCILLDRAPTSSGAVPVVGTREPDRDKNRLCTCCGLLQNRRRAAADMNEIALLEFAKQCRNAGPNPPQPPLCAHGAMAHGALSPFW